MSEKSTDKILEMTTRRSISDAERGYAKLDALGSPPTLELQDLRGSASHSPAGPPHSSELHEDATYEYRSLSKRFWDRFTGEKKDKVGWCKSLENVVTASCESLVHHCDDTTSKRSNLL